MMLLMATGFSTANQQTDTVWTFKMLIHRETTICQYFIFIRNAFQMDKHPLEVILSLIRITEVHS